MHEDLFDQFMEVALHKPLHEAFEPIAKTMFHAELCALWVDVPDRRSLVAASFNLTAPYATSLPGFVFRTRNVIQVRDPSQAPGGFKCDLAAPNSQQLLFPLTARAVVQVVRSSSFAQPDLVAAAFLREKFETYGAAIFGSHTVSEMALTLYTRPCTALQMLRRHFRCESAECWQCRPAKGTATLHREAKPEETLQMPASGVVAFAAENRRAINASDEGAIADVYPVGNRELWVAVLRGRNPPFSASDSIQLSALMHFVVGSFVGFDSLAERAAFTAQLGDLMNSALILVRGLGTELTVIRREVARLLECDRCLLYVVGKRKSDFKAFLSHGMKTFPAYRGIAGRCISTREVTCVGNPQESKYFDVEVDTDPKYQPTSILSLPIVDGADDVLGSISCLSKARGRTFSDLDRQILTAVSVFVGVALQNSTAYRRLHNLTKLMQLFLLLSFETPDDLKSILLSIVTKTARVLNASRISIMVRNHTTDTLDALVSAGEIRPPGFGEALQAMETRQTTNSPTGVSRSAPSNDKFTRVSSALSLKSSLSSSTGVDTLYCIPLGNGKPLGVAEITVFGELTQAQQDVVSTFTLVATTALEHLPDLFAIKPDDWIDDKERSACAIPRRLVLPDDVFSATFNADNFSGIGLFRVLFKLFEFHHFFEEFEISAEMFFGLLTKLRDGYGENFGRAVESTQYLIYLLGQARPDIGRFELLGLVLSVLCRDLGGDDDPHLRNSGAISCQKATELLGDLFHTLSQRDLEVMWRIIVELILAKDMGLHFVVIRQLTDLVESGEFNISGQSAHRLLLMKVLLKCADMAPVMRPLADPGRWDVELAEKFFRTGHLEEAKLVHSGQPPTYENLDKEESMMGFFCGVCLPLAAVLVKACSSLKAIPDILKGNIQKWAKATKRPVPQFAPPARKKT